MFATEAYSMGTDVSNIRRVVHAGPPKTMESTLILTVCGVTRLYIAILVLLSDVLS